jgi:hypothetical protein
MLATILEEIDTMFIRTSDHLIAAKLVLRLIVQYKSSSVALDFILQYTIGFDISMEVTGR